MVKEAVHEVLIGQLGTIIAEVVKGLNQNVLIEQQQPAVTQSVSTTAQPSTAQPTGPDPLTERMNKLKAERQATLEKIGNTQIGGVNIFEGTAALSTKGEEGSDPKPTGPLGDIAPNDPGVNIDGLMGIVGNKWKNNLVS